MELGERRWTEVDALAKRVVILPLGSLEQHGPHLPLLTDTLIVSEIARRAALELGEGAVFLPPLWLGASDHHLGFPGTVSAAQRTYADLLERVLENLIGSGFRRVILLNAHAGNAVPAQMAMYEVQNRHYQDKPDLWLAFVSWFELAQPEFAALGLAQHGVLHACELETSMILALRPDLVSLESAATDPSQLQSAFFSPDFTGPNRVSVARAMEQLSATGALGAPQLATAEKGGALFEAATRTFVAFAREFATWPPTGRNA